MNPAQNTSPDESALPNVSLHQNGGAGSFAMPSAPAGGNHFMSGSAAPDGNPAPVAPPPVATGAEAAWLPPTVPVGQGSHHQGASENAAGAPVRAANVQAPAVADDGDVIEKEWVDQAKQIVARNRQDPYLQTKELHKFKTEYLQKRYNKTIEAEE